MKFIELPSLLKLKSCRLHHGYRVRGYVFITTTVTYSENVIAVLQTFYGHGENTTEPVSSTFVIKNDISMRPTTSKSTGSDEHKMQDMCIAGGCKQPAVSHPEWDNEYCSIKCCYNHCKTIFQSWLDGNKAATKAKSSTSSSIQVPGPSSQHT